MENWSWILVLILAVLVKLLWGKVYLMRKSAREIREAFSDRLMTNTNTLIDLSSRDRSMRELADSINTELRKLRMERHRYQQGDSELKTAVTNISHDIRTPLTAICGYLDLLEREEMSETAERYLPIIRERTEALKQLTEELFRYSVVTSTVQDISCEEVELNRVLEESISAYYAALKGSHITPAISMTEQKVRRYLNREALSRIFGNIISNAIKYSDGDLSITLSESGEIIFSNHASGQDEVQAGQLFDRFYTVETARKSTGLGLSIAKILTEQMHGVILARYEEGLLSIHVLFQEEYERER